MASKRTSTAMRQANRARTSASGSLARRAASASENARQPTSAISSKLAVISASSMDEGAGEVGSVRSSIYPT